MYPKKSWRIFSALLCCSLFLPLSASKAEHITGVSIHDVSSELNSFLRVAQFVVDGSGLSGDIHTTVANETMWLNTGNGYFGGTPGPDQTNPGGVGATITFDLGTTYDLSEMKIWNYNERDLTKRGARSVSVYTAPDLTSAYQHFANYEFLEATGAGYVGDIYQFHATGARLVKFQINSNHWANQQNDASLVGLSEVRFFGTASVPEPSSMMLIAAASVGVLMKRRRSLA